MNIMRYTPFNDPDHKLDIMDHVNQDHDKELLVIAQSYCQDPSIQDASIIDIYQEGILLLTHQDLEKNNPQQHFIAFALKGDLEEQILYLAYCAFAKQNIGLNSQQQQFFEVLEKQQISKNITRLSIKGLYPFPTHYAAYGYSFVLKKIQKSAPMPRHHLKTKLSVFNQLFTRSLLWLMKHLSKNSREKLIKSMNKDVRIYTLRKAFSTTADSVDFDHGYVDIFSHGQSAGSLWIKSLHQGDLIFTRSEVEDKHIHLQHGQAVLIADETAFPAVAGILELWENPQPPIVILCAVDAEDLKYVETIVLPEGAKLHQLACPIALQAGECLRLLADITIIDAVWAALEHQTAKQIRHYLRNQRQLSGKNNHVKAYWRDN